MRLPGGVVAAARARIDLFLFALYVALYAGFMALVLARPDWLAARPRVGEEFPLECPGCGGDIRLIAFRLLSECETIPGLRTPGDLRLLRTSCPRDGADPQDSHTRRRAAGATTRLAAPGPTHRLGRACPGS
jgi:hypothetical protein